MDLHKALIKAALKIPRREAELLAAHALGKGRAWVIAHGEYSLSATEAEAIALTVEARALGSPIAYLVGEREFYGRPFKVDQRVLIPRPETELLVEAALARMPVVEASVLDLGTGSGAIALTLALERPAIHVTAVDASAAALDCASDNAAALGAENIAFMHGQWYAPVAGWTFDLIVSNPPYVAGEDAHLKQGDLRFEPRQALTDGSGDGLDSIRAIVAGAPAHLAQGGWLLLEHGYDQAPACAALLAEAGFTECVALNDLAGIPRVAGGRKL
ncbi:MAG: peptide chain release factor N(5)-glutamine methyltransferase [Betaproteobacteria bacterium]|nr:peptide chain release factor N(5)-glutamine methyltransferase [Betaproteobacteria bacterium]